MPFHASKVVKILIKIPMTSLKLIMGTFSYAVQPAIRSLRKVLLLAAGCLELLGFLAGLAQ